MVMSVARSSQAGSGLPPVDAHLVAEDAGYEIIEGRLVAVSPCHEPHGERHSKVNALLEAFVTSEYNVACDMLTRTAEESEVAPDASVYPVARDPETGGRQLEVLAFQVVATETLSHASKKAVMLAERGVRRIFAVDVDRKRALEWSRETNGWQVLGDADVIDDEVFVAPLPIEALVKAAKADDALALALLAKRNPVLVASEERAFERGREHGREEDLRQGRAEGMQRSLLAILQGRGLTLTAAQRERIETCRDADQLARWIERVLGASATEHVFDDGE
jgi:Uma2 family endonuclease